jgi:hypothetical protein
VPQKNIFLHLIQKFFSPSPQPISLEKTQKVLGPVVRLGDEPVEYWRPFIHPKNKYKMGDSGTNDTLL